jgi:hypothetical protein
MSTLEVVNVNGQEYGLVVEAGQVVGMKRFNKEHKMWVVLRFSDVESDAEELLLDHLTAEYVKHHI